MRIASYIILQAAVIIGNLVVAEDAEWERRKNEAMNAFENKEYEKAEKAFSTLANYLVLNNTSDWRVPYTYGLLGDVYIAQEKLDKAEKTILAALDAFNKQIPEWARGRQSRPEYDVLLHNRGLAYLRLARIKKKKEVRSSRKPSPL